MYQETASREESSNTASEVSTPIGFWVWLCALLLRFDGSTLAKCGEDERRDVVFKCFSCIYSSLFTGSVIALVALTTGFSQNVASIAFVAAAIGVFLFDSAIVKRNIEEQISDSIGAPSRPEKVRRAIWMKVRFAFSASNSLLGSLILVTVIFAMSLEDFRQAEQKNVNAKLRLEIEAWDDRRTELFEQDAMAEAQKNLHLRNRVVELRRTRDELATQILALKGRADCEEYGLGAKDSEVCNGSSGVPGKNQRYTFAVNMAADLSQELKRVETEIAKAERALSTSAAKALHDWSAKRSERIDTLVAESAEFVTVPNTLLHKLDMLHRLILDKPLALVVVVSLKIFFICLDLMGLFGASKSPVLTLYVVAKAGEVIKNAHFLERRKGEAYLNETLLAKQIGKQIAEIDRTEFTRQATNDMREHMSSSLFKNVARESSTRREQRRGRDISSR